MEEGLFALEEMSSDIGSRQAVSVNELDKVSIAGSTGCRSTTEWVSSRLDVSRAAASDLVYAARWKKRYRRYGCRLFEGAMTFDRAVATMRLAVAGADEATLAHSELLDLAGVDRLTVRQRRVTRLDEREAFVGRFVAVQPTFDESTRHLTGVLAGVGGRIVADAVCERGDELRQLPGGDVCTRGQRQADGPVALAMDSLDRDGNTEMPSGPSVSVFVDLDEANGTTSDSDPTAGATTRRT